MKLASSFSKVLRHSKKMLFDDGEDELHAYVRGPLCPRPVLYALLIVFGFSDMLTVNWSASCSSTPKVLLARWALSTSFA